MLADDRVVSMGQLKPFDILTECRQMTSDKFNCLKYNWWFNCLYRQNVFRNHISNIYLKTGVLVPVWVSSMSMYQLGLFENYLY